MKKLTSIAVATVLSVLGIANPVSAEGMIKASGEFTATVDFTTLTLTQVDANCLLEVSGVIEFTGTLEGLAPARTRALVLASCEEVAVTPPGNFKDVFSSRLAFAGTVNGPPTVADITYQGITEVGGDIDAVLRPSGGLKGVLEVKAIVAVGGSYTGLVKPE
jgi:hypothetical protein